jgi:hypothetical protein
LEPSSDTSTLRLGVVSGSIIELVLEVEAEGVIGSDHSSSLTPGELAAEEETSPRREGCFLRDRLAEDREDDEGGIMLL